MPDEKPAKPTPPKNTPAPAEPAPERERELDPDRVPIGYIRFMSAIDFPGQQLQGFDCVGKHTPSGLSYVCHYIVSLGAFEVVSGRNGERADEKLIPRERVDWYRRLAA